MTRSAPLRRAHGEVLFRGITKNSVVVPGLDDHGDDRVKREVDGVPPFREIRRQPDLRWFASGLIVDELDPVDDEGRRRYTIYAGRQEQFETDLHFVDAAFGGRVVFRHSRNPIGRPPVFFGVDRKTPRQMEVFAWRMAQVVHLDNLMRCDQRLRPGAW